MRKRPTKSELLLWTALRRNQLNGLHFLRQQIVGNYIADFYCASKAFIVEVDGSSHNGRAKNDLARDNFFKRQGLRTLRIDASRVFSDLSSVLREIAAFA